MADYGPPIASAPPMSSGSALSFQRGTIPPTVPRLVLYAVEGFGKTTIAASMPNAAIIMARGETGYLTLLGENRVPDCPRLTVESWDDLLATLRGIAKDPGDIRTVILDALGGFERLCHEKVCHSDYKGDWKDFNNFGSGINTALREWIKIIGAMDAVNDAGVAVLTLAHAQVKTEKAVGVPDYDRYVPRLASKSWDLINQWADGVLFGNFKPGISGGSVEGKKGHAILTGGRGRVIYTMRSDAYDAKNKYAMPAEIPIPDDHTKAWSTIAEKITFYKPASGDTPPIASASTANAPPAKTAPPVTV